MSSNTTIPQKPSSLSESGVPPVADVWPVGIVGAGTMGRQIAALFAFIGHQVQVFDSAPPVDFAQKVSRGQRLLSRDERLAARRLSTAGSCTLAATVEALADSALIIECIPEDLTSKVALLKNLDRVASVDTTLATNTSSLSIAEMAAALSRPSRLIGMHFFNPIHAIPLVELCALPQVPPSVIPRFRALLEGLGRTVVALPDTPGFVVNRLLFLMIASAIQMVEREHLTPTTVDAAMRTGASFPMGPLELADLIGLDVCLMILKNLYLRTGNPSYAPPPLLERLVTSGKLGGKTGAGFYTKGD